MKLAVGAQGALQQRLAQQPLRALHVSRINSGVRLTGPSRRCLSCSAAEATEASTSGRSPEALYLELEDACSYVKQAPPSEKQEASQEILTALNTMKASKAVQKWGAALEGDGLKRRNVFLGELRKVGIAQPDAIGKPSIRNDAAFLYTTVGVVSVIAVAAGQLPGDWGFFVPYLVGGIPLVVLAIGSTAPGLLQVVIDRFSLVFPDYRERVLKHEAAHFLAGYLLGCPVAGYSLELGKAHTDFAEAKLRQRLIELRLEDEEVDQLAVLALAGAAAEAMNYEEVLGQTADLVDLQRILLRSKTKLSDATQQNMTRWAVFEAAGLLRKYSAEYAALQEAMRSGASVAQCIRAIETA